MDMENKEGGSKNEGLVCINTWIMEPLLLGEGANIEI